MKTKDARKEFEKLLHASGKSLEALTPMEGVSTMLKFYRDVRALDCDLKEDGDMLLFQWGTHDWGRGGGERFEVDITRQLIPMNTEDEIWQLSLTFAFEPRFEALRAGNKWCWHLEEVGDFENFLNESPVLRAVRDVEVRAAELSYENVE
jgi:hypothetical protein